jgi:hypothetical protein
MTELTEQQQRTLYEWLRPELKGKDWVLRDIGPLGGKQAHTKPVFGQVMAYLPPLDYNTFMGEVALKLDTEGIWLSLSAGMWRLDESDDDLRWHLVSQDTDPWVMLVKYLQGK